MKLKNGEELTEAVAIRITLELWEWLAETGRRKGGWPGWKKYGRMLCGCPLCEFYRRGGDGDCELGRCPLAQQREYGCHQWGFSVWDIATTKTQSKKYAKLFLEQLRRLNAKP